MEWMLQVVDEVDDAVGMLWLCGVGLAAEIGLMQSRRRPQTSPIASPRRSLSDRRGYPPRL
jgi:hypothetical protein